MMIFARSAALWSLLLLVVFATRPRPVRLGGTAPVSRRPDAAELDQTSLEAGDYLG
ncbi:hypothetical protein [Frondihabitans sp. PAMC 28766]|uniref:hypothetical protein n=1 Tax=Frondihabitans sp. PAMC 28766 TaxID=1795630 RepID=UPI0012FF8414|nr:hypothetical protein [Frondihabitans sp. PAMC 28766]